MTTRSAILRLIAVCLATSAVTDAGSAGPKRSPTAPPQVNTRQSANDKWPTLPVLFEPNLGQADSQVRFLTRAAGMASFLMDRENVIVLSRRKSQFDPAEPKRQQQVEQTVVRMKLEGARIPGYEGLERASSVSAYFIGNDPSKWLPEVPHYQKVKAHGVYKGVDLVYYGNGQHIEYDFIVAPGVDPSQIRLAYSGTEGLKTDHDGNLLIATPLGALIQRKPKVYQEFGSERREIEATYAISGGRVQFALSAWDRSRPLVIDPTVEYSTYLGGAGLEIGYGIAASGTGEIFVTGLTPSIGLPSFQGVNAGGNDVFVAKFLPRVSGNLQLGYAVYIGGAADDSGRGIAVDSSGAAYVTGSTASPDFPIVNSALPGGTDQDAIVLKINPHSGGPVQLAWSGRIGGTNTSSYKDVGLGIALDSSGAAYVTGTAGSGFPVLNELQSVRGANDAFVSKVVTDGSGKAVLSYSTALGGAAREEGDGIAVDATGAVYVGGWTSSSDYPTLNAPFPAKPGGYDAIAFKLLPYTGGRVQLGYSTYLGGAGLDQGAGIAVDAAGAAYVTGRTQSSDFPVMNAYQTAFPGGETAFVVKLQAHSSGQVQVAYSTYLGGTGGDTPLAITVDSAGAAIIAGVTRSRDFPTFNPSPCVAGGGQEMFVARYLPYVSGTVALDFSTLIGGAGPDAGFAITSDAAGALYVTGDTASTNFPVINPYQPALAGSYDAFVFKLSVTPSLADAVSATGGTPQTAAVNTAFGTPLKVRVTSNGNPLRGASVIFTLPSSGASARLSSTAVNTDCNGQASVSATANLVAGSYAVTAAVAGAPTPATFALTNQAGTLAQLRFSTQPQDTPAGTPINTVGVRAEDTFGNPVNGVSIVLTAQGGAGTLMGTTTIITGANGIASFSNLQIRIAGTYELRAVSGSLAAVSDDFRITPAPAATISVYDGNNQGVQVGNPYAPIRAIVKDAFGNPVPGALVDFAAPDAAPGVPGIAGLGRTAIRVAADSNGIAASPQATANQFVGSFTVTAATAGAPAPATFTGNNLAGDAARFAFVQQPANTVAGQTMAAVVVQLTDRFGNPLTTTGVPVTLSLSPPEALGGTATVNTNNGLATFTTLSINRTGTYRLLAQSPNISTVASTEFQITAGPAANLSVSGADPQSTAVNTPFPYPLQVTVTDAFGNPVAGATVSYTPNDVGGASADLSALSALSGPNGVATVTATANGVAGSYTVTAGVAGFPGTGSFNLTNVPGGVDHASFVNQPTDTTAGAIINVGSGVAVRLADATGNGIPGKVITLTAQPGTLESTPSANPISGTTDATGAVTFSSLFIRSTGSYLLRAVVGGESISTISNNFQITAAPPAMIAIEDGDNQKIQVGRNYGPFRAIVKDTLGNPVPGVSVTLTVPASGPGFAGLVSGPIVLTTDSSGLATVPVALANNVVGPFTVAFSITASPTPATFHFENLPGNANLLTFSQQPGNSIAGSTISPAVTVQVRDQFGNPVATSGIAVTLQLVPPARSSGTLTQVTNASGLATFNDLKIDQAGRYQYLAEAPGLSSVTSTTFNVSAAAVSAIEIVSGTPQSALVLTPFANRLEVRLTDRFDNPVSGQSVAFAPPGAGPSASLSAPSGPTDANGRTSVMATASAIAGNYVVSASAAGTTSVAFALMNLSAGPGHITFVQQPQNTAAGSTMSAVSVLVADGGGNPVGGVSVTLTARGGDGTLNGTTTVTTGADGSATFTDLNINVTGTYTLQAAASSLSALSNSFQVTAASGISITAIDGGDQTAPVNTAYDTVLTARVSDPFGNAIAGAAVTFTGPASGAGVTFGGSQTVTTNSAGLAISPTFTANSSTGTFQVTATTPGASSQATYTLTNAPATANRLIFVQQPTDIMVGQTMTPAVTVQLENNSGARITQAGVPVSLQPARDTQTSRLRASNAVVPTDANGMATFADLTFSTVGIYRLQASTSGGASAQSNSFHVTSGTPTTILAGGGTPQSAVVQTVFGEPLVVTVSDAGGNPVPGVQVKFQAPDSGPSGTFGGATVFTAVTDLQGRASAICTANNFTGSYSVSATVTEVTGSASFALTNLPRGATSLVFVQQPGNTAAGQVIAPPVTVRIQDGQGQPVAMAGVAVVLSLSSGTGTLLGTVVQLTDDTGLATFQDLRIGETGTKRLRASTSQQAPVDSSSFEITAGSAVKITVFSGAPQSTTISTDFPAQLQAQVTDIAGNPVGGVPVTFSAPSSGPSGTFSGVSSVTTGPAGIATSPILTANNQPGSFVVTATAPGVPSPAAFALTNLPQQSSSITVGPSTLSFFSEINQPAPAGQTVQITSASGAPVSWTSASSAAWLSASPASGSTPGQLTVSVNPAGLAPGIYTGSIRITAADGSLALVLVTYTLSDAPALVIAPPVLVFTTSSNTVAPAAQTLTATSSSRTIAYRVSAQVSTPAGGTWLQVSTAQGQTTGTVNVTVNPAGLSNGVYDGSVLFTPTEAGINQVAVPVTLIVGCSQGGCLLQPRIIAVVNGASFQPGGAPRAAMSIFGTQLSDGVYQTQAYPLPGKLGPTSVTVNGVLVPLYYVSPTQINFQMPGGIPPAGAIVVVNNDGVSSSRGLHASPSHPTALTPVDPGLFVTSDKRAAALNADLSPHTAATPIAAGEYVILYLTGEGPVTPPVGDGAAAPGSPLSTINAPVQVTIGGKLAQTTYQGLAPGFAGLAQLNVIVPAGLSPGNQPVFVTINGIPSNSGVITVR